MTGRTLVRKTLVLISLTFVFLLSLAIPASAWHVTAGCVTAQLDAGRDILGKTTVVYADHTKQHFNIETSRFNVNQQSEHGPVVRVLFSNGESVEVGPPVGCEAPPTAPPNTSTSLQVVPSTTVPAPSTTTTISPPVPSAPAELPHTE